MSMKGLVISALFVGLSGCSTTHDFLKMIESKAYDGAARAVSEYCERANKGIIKNERVEARREIRQRGFNGPPGPYIPFDDLDNKTAYGPGPVVLIYCADDEVPFGAWSGLIR